MKFLQQQPYTVPFLPADAAAVIISQQYPNGVLHAVHPSLEVARLWLCFQYT